MSPLRHAVVLALCLVSVAAAWGQDQLAALKAKAALTDEDKTNLRQMVKAQVAAVVQAGTGADAALKTLREAPTGATPAFHDAFIAACVDTIGPAVTPAEPAAAIRLMTLVVGLNDPATVPVLTQSLKDQRPPVRLLGATGLAHLAPALAKQGAPAVAAATGALTDAGKAETSVPALQAIYAALDYSAVPDAANAKGALDAVLALLEARGALYATGKVPAEAGDLPGLVMAGKQVGQLDAPAKRRLTIAAAQMLRQCVAHYTSSPDLRSGGSTGPNDPRTRTEVLIETAEKLLGTLGVSSPQPGITTAMQQSGDVTQMRIAMNKWADVLKPVIGQDLTLPAVDEPPPAGRATSAPASRP